MSIFAAAPFLGPTIGPIVGGFVGQTVGWRWVEGVMAIFTGTLWIAGALYIPETYSPVLLQKRAKALSKATGKRYISILENQRGKVSPAHAFKTALARPWALLFHEPIVLLISIYMAVLYGTLVRIPLFCVDGLSETLLGSFFEPWTPMPSFHISVLQP